MIWQSALNVDIAEVIGNIVLHVILIGVQTVKKMKDSIVKTNVQIVVLLEKLILKNQIDNDKYRYVLCINESLNNLSTKLLNSHDSTSIYST